MVSMTVVLIGAALAVVAAEVVVRMGPAAVCVRAMPAPCGCCGGCCGPPKRVL